MFIRLFQGELWLITAKPPNRVRLDQIKDPPGSDNHDFGMVSFLDTHGFFSKILIWTPINSYLDTHQKKKLKILLYQHNMSGPWCGCSGKHSIAKHTI